VPQRCPAANRCPRWSCRATRCPSP
jgi:hypothetical protein